MSVHQPVAGGNGRGVHHVAGVAYVYGRVGPESDRDFFQILDIRTDHGVHRHHRPLAVDGDVSRWCDHVPFGDRGNHLVWGQVVGFQALRVGPDDDGSLVASEGGRSRYAGETGEHGADAEQGRVLDLADGNVGVVGGKNQVADGHAARVEAHDEGRNGARWHERAGAVDVADRLGHSLGHVGAGVKVELHQGHALDVLRFDVVDAGDVEEVVLVVVGEEALHLLRVQAAVGLGHVNDRRVQVGEDVHGHAENGQDGSQHNGNDGHHHRDRMPHREDNRVHRSTLVDAISDNWADTAPC